MAGTLAKIILCLITGTKNKSKSIEERLPKIKRFHWWTQYQMALEEPQGIKIYIKFSTYIFVNTTNIYFFFKIVVDEVKKPKTICF